MEVKGAPEIRLALTDSRARLEALEETLDATPAQAAEDQLQRITWDLREVTERIRKAGGYA